MVFPAKGSSRSGGIPTRRRGAQEVLLVIRELAQGWRRVSDISERLGVHRRSVYRTLVALRAVGLAPQKEARGRERYLRLTREAVTRWLA